jgi:hypothetical protein
MNIPRVLLAVIVVILLIGMVAVACVPADEVQQIQEKKLATPSDIGNMKLLSQQDDVQVWKLVDGNTVCYITINDTSYKEAGIFCLK